MAQSQIKCAQNIKDYAQKLEYSAGLDPLLKIAPRIRGFDSAIKNLAKMRSSTHKLMKNNFQAITRFLNPEVKTDIKH